jgi:hypothetical protein
MTLAFWLPPEMTVPHTVQSDTTRCGASRVGHVAKRPRLQPIDSTSQKHQNNVILLLDNNALILLDNVMV